MRRADLKVGPLHHVDVRAGRSDRPIMFVQDPAFQAGPRRHAGVHVISATPCASRCGLSMAALTRRAVSVSVQRDIRLLASGFKNITGDTFVT
jgi:hypothetical protein